MTPGDCQLALADVQSIGSLVIGLLTAGGVLLMANLAGAHDDDEPHRERGVHWCAKHQGDLADCIREHRRKRR